LALANPGGGIGHMMAPGGAPHPQSSRQAQYPQPANRNFDPDW